MRISVIIRPRQRMPWMEEVRAEVEALRGRDHEVWPRVTFEAGDAARMARGAVEGGAELIIAAGGDGTVNEVVNGVVGAGWTGALGIVPLGTANDFALSLGIPEEISRAFEVVVDGADRAVDVARVNDRHFVNVSTGGAGATATWETSSDTKRLLGPLAYLVTGVQKLPELHPSVARFSTPDGERYAGEVMLYAVGNGRQTGAGSQLTPQADFNDGELDVLIVPGMTRMDFMALAPRLRSGSHVGDPGLHYFRTDRLTVECDEQLAVNADGETITADRYEYAVSDETLAIRVP